MTAAQLGWTLARIAVATAAAVLLWRAARSRDQTQRASYRWLASGAACWGAGNVAQQVFADPMGGPTPLTVGDLLMLAGLLCIVIGIGVFAGIGSVWKADALKAPGGWRSPGAWRPAVTATGPEPGSTAGLAGQAADGILLACSLFVVGWITILRPDWVSADASAGGFALDMVHPLADLVALGVVLPLMVRNVRATLVPALALVGIAVGDALAVGAAAAGTTPGTAAQLCWLGSLCMLALAPARLRDLRGIGGWRPAGAGGAAPAPDQDAGPAAAAAPGVSTIVAAVAACAAILVLAGMSLGGHVSAGPVLVAVGTVAGLTLAGRLAWLVRQTATTAERLSDSHKLFTRLAERTSDAVLVCDAAGMIGYASPAVSAFGYQPEALAGARLASLVHPEDRVAAVRAAVGGLRDGSTFAGRVRAADGSWRHVECTLARHGGSGPARLLVTARDVSDRVALRQQVTHLTFHDGLTGLPNRAYLEDRTRSLLGAGRDQLANPDQRATRQQPAGRGPAAGQVTGAIFVDLDGFTGVNDSVGHGAGDLLLAQAGRRLRAAAPHAIVARWGGDEFAILVEDASSAQELVDLAERLANRIAAEPFSVAGIAIPLTASVGVALADASGTEHLLRNADVAMSRAKESGGGRVEVFAAHMHADVLRQLEIATDLQQAIANHQLAIEYQPVVELATSRVTAVEALVRWSREGVQMPPAAFLAVAEESGLIVGLGDWVLREASRQVAAWRATGWNIGLAVNFSLRQVSAPGFAQAVAGALAETGLPAGALTVEVTERVLVDSSGQIASDLASLRRSGIRLAIDDFGTGYASLAFLRQLAVDTIKIDPSFVAGLGTDPTLTLLTRTIVLLGRDLGIEVVAEGIERPEQLEQLKAIGCSLGQGFLVAKPMTARGIDALHGSAAAGAVPGQQNAAAETPVPAA